MEYFNNSIHTPEGVGLYTLLQVLRVLLASVSNLDAEHRKSLQSDLVTLVKRFSIPPELISTAIDIATIVSWLGMVSHRILISMIFGHKHVKQKILSIPLIFFTKKF